MRKSVIMILLAAGLLALSGCGLRQLAKGEIKPPKITLTAITLEMPKHGAWPVSCTLLLKNPNDETLSLLGYDYELRLEGQSVAQGASDQAVTLPALGETVVEFPILVKLPAVLTLLPRLLQEDCQLHYQVSGHFRLASLLGGLRVPFHFQGQLTGRQGLERLKRQFK